MAIYIVLNKDNEEISTFTERQHAQDLASQLQDEFSIECIVEERYVLETANPDSQDQ